MDNETLNMKRILDELDSVKGSATSMVSLIIPQQGDLTAERKKLDFEYTTAASIKSRV